MEFIFGGICILAFIYLVIGFINGKKGVHPLEDDDNWTSLENFKLEDPSKNEYLTFLKSIYESGELTTKEDAGKMVEHHKNHPEDDRDENYLGALELALTMRGSISAPSSGIILLPNEKCYFKTKNCALSTIEKLGTNVSYSGFSSNANGFRTGSFRVHSTDVEGLRVSCVGMCYITNKRLIIKGHDNKTKVYALNSIISYAPYGNIGIVICIANSNPIIVEFPCNGKFFLDKRVDIAVFEDDKFTFIYALENAINNV